MMVSAMRGIVVVLGPTLFVTSQLSAQSSVLIEVSAGQREWVRVPLTVTLPEAFREAKSVYMQRLDTAQEVVCQRSVSDPTSLCWILEDRLPRGQSRRYRVIASNIARRATEHVTVRDSGRALTMYVGSRPALTYHTAVVVPPKGIDRVFARSGFVHPVATPAGRIVTADFPADHAHQHGLFFAWKQTEFDGRPVDFWNQADQTGTVEHTAVEQVQNGPVFAEIQVKLQHLDLSAPEGPTPALDEEWTLTLYNLRDVHVFDLASRQTSASESPLKILEYHYGGMGYRGPTDWLGEDGPNFAMRTSEGMTRIDGNHSRPKWVEAIGTLQGTLCGIRVAQHPTNFRYPQPVRLHPSKPYFVFAPEVLGEFSIEFEQTYESRYRYIAYDGKPSAAVELLAESYVDPPTVQIVE